MGSQVLESQAAAVTRAPAPAGLFRNDTVSVVLRFHDARRLPFLDEALFSLAVQTWPDLEVVIAIQNGSEELAADIRRLTQNQPWRDGTRVQIFSVKIEEGVDGRSRLLNEGIRRATGRYLAFLDDDDVVYQHAYSTLVGRLRAAGAAMAVGGSRVAKIRSVGSHWHVVNKEAHFRWGRTQEDLFIDNFIPIHSYVIDRTRIEPEHLHFDESLAMLEDYDLLLRFAVVYEFDCKALGVPVCEYRLRLDGSNSIPYQESGTALTPALQQARREIAQRKERLLAELPPDVRSRFIRQAAPSPVPEDPGDFVFKAARKVHLFFTRHPRLEIIISRLAHISWRQYKRFRKLVAGKNSGAASASSPAVN